MEADEIEADFDYRLDSDPAVEPAFFGQSNYRDSSVQRVGLLHSTRTDNCGCGDICEPGCGCDDYCEPGCGCDDQCCDDCCDSCCGDSCCGTGCDVLGSTCGAYGPCAGDYYPNWNVGFEWTGVKPRFSENVAYTTLLGDANNNMNFTDTEFDYDLELAPRMWIQAAFNDEWSWRFSYWQFDQSPAFATATQVGGFDEITHPTFANVDISTDATGEVFSAWSNLNAYSLDFEALKSTRFCRWQFGVGGGMRYASVQQSYLAQLRDNANALLGQVDYSQELEGFGPTMSLAARRRLAYRVQLVCAARASLLYGDGNSRLLANEDINLSNPFQTTRTTSREDLLTIGEARVGLEWVSPVGNRGWQWLLSTAMEGQVWGNAGNATSEHADLGFFGFNFGAGFMH